MRILVVGPALKFPWVEYTATAFRRLGHTTSVFWYSRIWANRIFSPKVGDRLAGAPALLEWWNGRGRYWRQARDDSLVVHARRVRPELTVVLKGELLTDDGVRALRQEVRGPVVTWWTDDPWRYPSSVERWRLYEHAFIFDRSYVRRLASTGLTQAHFLPCACDESVYYPRRLSWPERMRYQCQIAFVGWYDPNRANVVRTLSGYTVGIWGQGWTSREARRILNGRIPRLRLRGYVRDAQAAKIYSAATIGLNIHHGQSCEAGLNTRTFELLAAGAFELVDAIPSMDELLTPGEEVVTYHSPDEARALVRYYLDRPAERTRIAERGRARVLREHTYLNRMQTLLRTVRR